MKTPDISSPPTGTTPAESNRSSKRGRKFMAGMFGGKKAQPQPSQTQETPSKSTFFQEANQSRRRGKGLFSSGVKMFTSSHPDTIRNRRENIGAAFGAKVNKFENGKSGGFMGPLFGMGFKNYDRSAAAQPSGSGAAAPAFSGAAAAQAGGPAPQSHSPFGQYPHMPAQQPQPQTFSGASQPPPVYHPFNPQAFGQYTQSVGHDFAVRMSGFQQNGAGPSGPFAGIGQNYTQPPQSPSFVSPQDRIDAARSAYKSAKSELKDKVQAQKDLVQSHITKQVSAAEDKINQIGASLDLKLAHIEKQSAASATRLQTEISKLKAKMKDIEKQMMPLRAASAAGGTDSMNQEKLDSETETKKMQFGELTMARTALREKVAELQEKLSAVPDQTAKARSAAMAEAEAAIGAYTDKIYQEKQAQKKLLAEIDAWFDLSMKSEMDRIAAQFGVAFGRPG